MNRMAASKRLSFFARVENFFNIKVSALGLGLFRIAYTLVLFSTVWRIYYFRHLLFDVVPYIEPAEINYAPVLIAWMVALVCMLVGLFTTTACVVNYVLTLLTFSAFHNYEYHVDYIYTSVNLLLIFAPISERLSLDSLRLRLLDPRHSLCSDRVDRQVSLFHYQALVLIGIGLVYFDSVFYKWMSPMWTAGLGVWLPASMPQVGWLDLTPLLDQKWLMLFLGYSTLILESTFIFLMWWKWPRYVLLFVGLGLHLAISIVFPIPRFGLAVSALYLLLVPPAWYEWIASRFRRREPRIELFYDPACLRVQRVLVVLKQLDFRRAVKLTASEPGTEFTLFARRNDHTYADADAFCEALIATEWLSLFGRILKPAPFRWIAGRLLFHKRLPLEPSADNPMDSSFPSAIERLRDLTARRRLFAAVCVTSLMLACQSILILDAPLTQWYTKSFGGERLRFGIVHWFDGYRDAARSALGTTPHPVFMDSHFRGYNHIVGIAYRHPSGEVQWLPIIEEDGDIGRYNVGRFFVRWSFRANGPQVRLEDLEDGIRDYTAFWCRENHINLINVDFLVFVKRIDSPKLFTSAGETFDGWEPGFYRRQREKPWQPAGRAHWKVDGTFDADLKDIEKI